jgi:hypothetical protein
MYAGGREWTMTGIPTVKKSSKLTTKKRGPTRTQIRIFTRRQSASSGAPTIELWGRANGSVAIPKAIRDVKIAASNIPTTKTWNPDCIVHIDSIQFLEWKTLLPLSRTEEWLGKIEKAANRQRASGKCGFANRPQDSLRRALTRPEAAKITGQAREENRKEKENSHGFQ